MRSSFAVCFHLLPLIAKSSPQLAPNDMINAVLGTNWGLISIEKRTLRTDGTRSLRLIYDYGYTTNTQGGRQNKPKRKKP